MKFDQLSKLGEKCNERINDLADLTRYAPFIIFNEKRTALNEYIRENLAEPFMSAGNIIILNDNGEFAVDESNTEALEKWERIKSSLELGDDDMPGDLKRDLEEAKLYRKRSGNNPQKALLNASEVYNEANTSLIIR